MKNITIFKILNLCYFLELALVGWGGERNILYKDVGTSPSRHVLKTFKETPIEKTQKGQYLLEVSLDRYGESLYGD